MQNSFLEHLGIGYWNGTWVIYDVFGCGNLHFTMVLEDRRMI